MFIAYWYRRAISSSFEMSKSVWNSAPWAFGQSSGCQSLATFTGDVNMMVTVPSDSSLQNYLIPGNHLLGNPYNGSSEETWNVKATSENLPSELVLRNEHGGFSAGTINVSSVQIGGGTVLKPDGSVVSDSISDRSGLRYIRESETIDPIDFSGSLKVHGKVQIGSLDILPESMVEEYGSERLYVQGNMVVTGDITALSDQRIKENVTTVTNALERVRRLRGVYYTRTEDEKRTPCLGLIAQEVQTVFPEVVHETKDGVLGVSYGNLVAALVEAIKELEQLVQLKNEEKYV